MPDGVLVAIAAFEFIRPRSRGSAASLGVAAECKWRAHVTPSGVPWGTLRASASSRSVFMRRRTNTSTWQLARPALQRGAAYSLDVKVCWRPWEALSEASVTRAWGLWSRMRRRSTRRAGGQRRRCDCPCMRSTSYAQCRCCRKLSVASVLHDKSASGVYTRGLVVGMCTRT